MRPPARPQSKEFPGTHAIPVPDHLVVGTLHSGVGTELQFRPRARSGAGPVHLAVGALPSGVGTELQFRRRAPYPRATRPAPPLLRDKRSSLGRLKPSKRPRSPAARARTTARPWHRPAGRRDGCPLAIAAMRSAA